MKKQVVNVYEKHQPILGKSLFNLALKWSKDEDLPGTQKEREDFIAGMRMRVGKVNGSTSKRVMREAVEAAAADIQSVRRDRVIARRGPRGAGSRAGGREKVLGSRVVGVLPRGDMSKRLRDRIAPDVEDAIKDTYRTDDAGEVLVLVNSDPAKIGVSQRADKDWDYYSKATRYPKQIVTTTVTVPGNWRLKVLKTGLATVGGMVTLSADRLEGAPPGVDLFSATWLEQGRGYELRAVSGAIARAGDTVYHGKDAAAAVAGLRRKVGAQVVESKWQDLLRKYGIDDLAKRHPDLTVSLRDARNSGSCESGIKSWCHRTGLDYEKGEASLKDVYAAYQSAPLTEARAAILYAMRRQRGVIIKASSQAPAQTKEMFSNPFKSPGPRRRAQDAPTTTPARQPHRGPSPE